MRAPSQEAIGRFYSECSVVFGLIVTRAGGVKEALRAAARIAQKGTDQGLREIGTDAASLEAALKAELAPR